MHTDYYRKKILRAKYYNRESSWGKSISLPTHPFLLWGHENLVLLAGKRKEEVWEGNRSCGMNQATLSSHFDTEVMLQPRDARELQRALQVPAPPLPEHSHNSLWELLPADPHLRASPREQGEQICSEQEENPEGKKKWKRLTAGERQWVERTPRLVR